MNLKAYLLLVSISIFAGGIYSQNNDRQDSNTERKQRNFKHSIGVAASATLGRGFSYRFQPNKFGIQFTGIPVFRRGGEYTLNGGLKFMFTFLKTENFNMYSYIGSMARYEKLKVWGGPPNPPMPGPSNHQKNLLLNSSLGAGYNFYLGKYFEFSVNVGYGIYRWHPDDFNFAFSNIAGGAGIYYKF